MCWMTDAVRWKLGGTACRMKHTVSQFLSDSVSKIVAPHWKYSLIGKQATVNAVHWNISLTSFLTHFTFDSCILSRLPGAHTLAHVLQFQDDCPPPKQFWISVPQPPELSEHHWYCAYVMHRAFQFRWTLLLTNNCESHQNGTAFIMLPALWTVTVHFPVLQLTNQLIEIYFVTFNYDGYSESVTDEVMDGDRRQQILLVATFFFLFLGLKKYMLTSKNTMWSSSRAPKAHLAVTKRTGKYVVHLTSTFINDHCMMPYLPLSWP